MPPSPHARVLHTRYSSESALCGSTLSLDIYRLQVHRNHRTRCDNNDAGAESTLIRPILAQPGAGTPVGVVTATGGFTRSYYGTKLPKM